MSDPYDFSAHPTRDVSAVMDAVTRQYRRAYPNQDGHAAAENIARVTRGILDGPGSEFSEDADRFRSVVAGGRRENLLSGSDLTPEQQAQSQGFRGAGWTPEEYANLSWDDARFKLAPDEYLDRQHGRDQRLLDKFADSSLPAEPAPPLEVLLGGGALSEPTRDMDRARDAKDNALYWFDRSKGATHWAKPGSISTLANLINIDPASRGGMVIDDGANYPEDSSWEQGLLGSLYRSMSSPDGPMGQMTAAGDVSVDALQGFLQGEESPVSRAVSSYRLSGVNRTGGGVLPDSKDGMGRDEQVAASKKALDDMAPTPNAESHYLATGTPQSKGMTMLKDFFYNLADPTIAVNAPLAYARSAGKGVLAALRGAAGAVARELPEEAAVGGAIFAPQVINQFSELGKDDFDPAWGDTENERKARAAENRAKQKAGLDTASRLLQ